MASRAKGKAPAAKPVVEDVAYEEDFEEEAGEINEEEGEEEDAEGMSPDEYEAHLRALQRAGHISAAEVERLVALNLQSTADEEADFAQAMALNKKLQALEMEAKRQQQAAKVSPVPVRKISVASSGSLTTTGSVKETQALQKIRRENLILLQNLEAIQRKGGATDTRQKKVTHVAASSVNRKKHLDKVANENMAFLKRLEGVKSTVAKSGTPRSAKARPGPPKKKVVQPDWVS